MIENVLQQIGGVGIYGVISVCLFFAFFAATLVWAARLKRPYLNQMRVLPLEGETASQQRPNPNPEPPMENRHE